MKTPPRQPASQGVTRREFIGWVGAAGALATMPRPLQAIGLPGEEIIRPTRVFRLIRPQDLLAIDIELVNLHLVASQCGPVAHIASNGARGFIVFHFGGQHLAEQAVWDRGENPMNKTENPEKAPLTYRMWEKYTPRDNAQYDPPKTGGWIPAGDADSEFLARGMAGSAHLRRWKKGRRWEVAPDMPGGMAGAWIAGPSRVVFEVPQYLTPFAFDTATLFDLCVNQLGIVVHPRMQAEQASRRGAGSSVMTTEDFIRAGHHAGDVFVADHRPYTAIEYPALLHLSPYANARWALRPPRTGGNYELWALDLQTRASGDPAVGTPRIARRAGHLFAFAHYPAEWTRWPVQTETCPPTGKYAESERPKTSLYSATRQLLVKQMEEDNGDISAEKFSLSALGTSARLHYQPAVDLPSPRLDESGSPPDKDGKSSDKEGFLTEWIQKSELGRDYYTKESFAAVWLPFGFSAEVVTITERLPSTPRPASIKGEKDEARQDFSEEENRLTALLVARKFARIKGPRIREFGPTVSADFTEHLAKASRSIGLSSVEVLVDRTPVLANSGVHPAGDAESEERMRNGEDVLYDTGGGGSGREIFWPRVFVPAGEGKMPQRAVYRFPIRLTFVDGTDKVVYLPMLLAPDLRAGEKYYPIAPPELRETDVGQKAAIVEPAPAASISAMDLGDCAKVAGLFDSANDQPFRLAEIANGALVGVSRALDEAAVSVIHKKPFSKDITLENLLENLDGTLRGAGAQAEAKALEEWRRFVTRMVAWGEETIGAVDASAAAKRLVAVIEPVLNTAFGKDTGGKLVGMVTEQLEKLRIPGKSRKEIGEYLDLFVNAATVEERRKHLQKFASNWVAYLGPGWNRGDWDETFARLVETTDPDRTKLVLTSYVTKRLRLAALDGNPVNEIRELLFERTRGNAALDAALKNSLVEGLSGKQGPFRSMLQAVADPAEGCLRLRDAVRQALPEERGLQRRLAFLAQDLRSKTVDELAGELEDLGRDIALELAVVATEAGNGLERLRGFAREAFGEMEEFHTRFESTVKTASGNIRDSLSSGFEAMIGKGGDALQTLIVSSAPSQVINCIENLLDATGGRMMAAIADQIQRATTRVRSRRDELIRQIGSLESNASDVALAGAASAWQDLRREAEGIFGSYRSSVEKAIGEADDQVRELLKKIDFESEVFRRFLEARKDAIPDRLGRAALGIVRQVEDLALGLTDEKLRLSPEEIEALRNEGRKILHDLAGSMTVTREKWNDFIEKLEKLAKRLPLSLQSRFETLRKEAGEESCRILLRAQRLDMLFIGLALEESGAAQKMLDEIFGKFAGQEVAAIRDGLKEAVGLLEGIRQRIGDGRQLEEMVKDINNSKVPDDVKNAVREFGAKCEAVGNLLGQTIKGRVREIEGEARAMARRAAVALNSSTLLGRFQDQSRQAVMDIAKMRFDVESIGNGLGALLAHPKLDSLEVRVPGIEGVALLTLNQDYVAAGMRLAQTAQGLAKAAGGVFADVRGSVNSLADSAGVAEAKARIERFSRDAGALQKEAVRRIGEAEKEIRDNAENTVNKFKAEVQDLLPASMPKLFGKIPLNEVLKAVADPGKLPKLAVNELPDRIERVHVWKNELDNYDAGLLQLNPRPGSSFQIESRGTVWLPKPGVEGRPPSFSTRGSLDSFKLTVMQMMAIQFESLSFTANNGGFSCTPRLKDENAVEFLGPLKFVDEARKKLSSFTESKGLQIALDGEYVRAGLRVGIPSLSFGAVAIENFSLGFQLGLPISGSNPLVFRFALSERWDPFRVSVAGFAGGGFFVVELSSDPERCMVEGAIEFGGCLSISVVVASGTVSVMAGLYFKRSKLETIFEGYLRICGCVTVLGFIEVGILFFLGLAYRQRRGEGSSLTGRAKVSVRVKIGFFSKTVSFEYEKTIQGSRTASLSMPREWPGELLVAGNGTTFPHKPSNPDMGTPCLFGRNRYHWAEYWEQFDIN